MSSRSRWALALSGVAIGIIAGTLFNGPLLQGQNPPNPPAVPRELTSYREIVKQVLPAVVSIEAKAKPRPPQSARPRPVGDNPAPDDGNLGFGSGFVVDPAGVILTNFHVVEGADELEVQTADGRKYPTRDFKFDRASDLAFVRIVPKQPLTALPFGDSDGMEIGDRVLAMGAPFGLRGSVTHGIVSGKSRSLRLSVFEDFIQTDAAVNPGNSGGPLVSLDGKVIGITSAIKTRSGGFQGVGLAISSNHARTILDKLLKDGAVRRGYIGAIVDDLLPDSPQPGVLARRIIADSPAAKAGLRVGDIIVSIRAKAIQNGRDLQQIVNELVLGEPVDMIIVRGGQRYRLQVAIAEHPENESKR